ncbi:MAG TPA: hypothetical protein VEU74_04420 [Gemmatimonadales bacterium]|nr:hypothetical protein [Gemmatimonadales bacterium]
MAKREPSYEKWTQIQYQMAHHDIWWVKGQQMQAGNWTLALLAALVGVGHLKSLSPDGLPPATVGYTLALLGLLVTFLGALYVWDLSNTLVESRARARRIIAPLDDPEQLLVDATREPRRHWIFPWVISGVLFAGLGVAAWLLTVPLCVVIAAPAISWLLAPMVGRALR